MKRATLALVGASLVLSSCATVPPQPEQFDLIVRGGTVYDGGGGTPFVADVGVRGDRIVAVERRLDGAAKQVIDASGLAVAPGFINMLSWANDSLIIDGASESDIRQGVTLEVMGEGTSPGPITDAMAER